MLALWPFVAQGQDSETLADLRLELAHVLLAVQDLQQQLESGENETIPFDGAVLDRLGEMERELRRLTSWAEGLDFEIAQHIRQNSDQIARLEQQICTSDPACDPTQIGGLGQSLPMIIAQNDDSDVTAITSPQNQLTVQEASDFDAAKRAYQTGDLGLALDLFARFVATYPGGPFTAQALYLKGQIDMAQSAYRPAALAFLETYTLAGLDSDLAPDALLHLGLALYHMGKVYEGCLTVQEVDLQFPDTGAAAQSRQELAGMSCQGI